MHINYSYEYKIARRWCFHSSDHIFDSKYKPGFEPESQFFDKDGAVCLENSFCGAMASRPWTSAVLFSNWPMEREEILIIKLKGPHWLGVDWQNICSCMLISHKQQQHSLTSLFLIYLVSLNCIFVINIIIYCHGLIFPVNLLPYLSAYKKIENLQHSTVRSIIMAPWKSHYSAATGCDWHNWS